MHEAQGRYVTTTSILYGLWRFEFPTAQGDRVHTSIRGACAIRLPLHSNRWLSWPADHFNHPYAGHFSHPYEFKGSQMAQAPWIEQQLVHSKEIGPFPHVHRLGASLRPCNAHIKDGAGGLSAHY